MCAGYICESPRIVHCALLTPSPCRRIVRCCHPDKLVTNKALSSRDHAILAKTFTVLSDAYSAYSQMLS